MRGRVVLADNAVRSLGGSDVQRILSLTVLNPEHGYRPIPSVIVRRSAGTIAGGC
jgi:hypothetical protein